ncbi:MAG: hypothetical protein M3295_00625 [Chloroflexota bacterium]|nr:hypothetical protein [Chloroflexota bacterium]
MARGRRAIIVGGFALVMTGMFVATATGISARPDVCNRNEAGVPVVAEFDLSNGSELWAHLPAAGRAPELEGLPGPIHVVVFLGQHRAIPNLYGQLLATDVVVAEQPNTVCVVDRDGVESYYGGISLDGLVP